MLNQDSSLLLIPGLPRCATTSLVNILSQHSEIRGGIQKEPHYFLPSKYKSKLFMLTNNNRVKRLFPSLGFCMTKESFLKNYENRKEKYVIDASTLYSSFEESVDVISQSKLFKDIKCILIFKGAEQRALSHYNFSVSRQEEFREFNEALEQEVQQASELNDWLLKGYLRGSRIKPFVDKFIEIYGNTNLLLINLDKTTLFSPETINDICSFIGVDKQQLNFDVYTNKTTKIQSGLFFKIRIAIKNIRTLNPKLFDNKITRYFFNLFMKYAPKEQTQKKSPVINEQYSNIFKSIDLENNEIYKLWSKKEL